MELHECGEGTRFKGGIIRPMGKHVYNSLIEPHHGAINALVAAVLGMPVGAPETIIRTHALIGQIMVLLIGRPVLLRRLDWDEFTPHRIDQVSRCVTRSALSSLGLSEPSGKA